MHLIEIIKRWMLLELQGSPSVSSLVPANSIAGMVNTDDTPTRPGVYIAVPSSTNPQRWAGSTPVSLYLIAGTEQACYNLLAAVDTKFAALDRDRLPAWQVDPRTRGLRLHRVHIDRSESPVNLTVGTGSPLYAASVHLRLDASGLTSP